MIKPEIPANEPQRLETLRGLGILDTPAEERFDRITRMAKRLFNVPIALVSLVDENRQWFKSCMGVPVCETGRDISFCGHAILGDITFYIEDTTQDERFADNPLVTGAPFIRFYAGYPLSAPNGEKIGTLCIIDTVPRTLGEEDFLALKDLAVMVEQEFSALQMATMDELTNLSNRRGFKLLAEHSINLAKRHNVALCLSFFDLNDFKPINDVYGHLEGDRALTIFSQQLRESFRESDVCARLGGDEFAILFIHTNSTIVENLIERFAQDLKARVMQEGLPYEISFSYGIAEYDGSHHDSIEALIHSADGKMYLHKEQTQI